MSQAITISAPSYARRALLRKIKEEAGRMEIELVAGEVSGATLEDLDLPVVVVGSLGALKLLLQSLEAWVRSKETKIVVSVSSSERKIELNYTNAIDTAAVRELLSIIESNEVEAQQQQVTGES